jgi:hypothetical protein
LCPAALHINSKQTTQQVRRNMQRSSAPALRVEGKHAAQQVDGGLAGEAEGAHEVRRLRGHAREVVPPLLALDTIDARPLGRADDVKDCLQLLRAR